MLFVGQSHHVLRLSDRRPDCMWRWRRRVFWQLEWLVVLLQNSRLVGLAHHRHRHSHCWRKFLISYDSNFVSKIERFKQIWIFFFNEYQFVFCRQIIIAIVWAIIACNKASRAEAGSVYVQPAQPQPQPGVTYVTTTVRFKLIFYLETWACILLRLFELCEVEFLFKNVHRPTELSSSNSPLKSSQLRRPSFRRARPTLLHLSNRKHPASAELHNGAQTSTEWSSTFWSILQVEFFKINSIKRIFIKLRVRNLSFATVLYQRNNSDRTCEILQHRGNRITMLPEF